MVHMKVEYQTIGLIHSPFKDIKDMPIQTVGALGIQGTVEVFPAFVEGLQDLQGFSHIFLLYHFHQIKKSALVVTPYLDSQPRGVFATRAPKRPNPIGLSVVKLSGLEKNIIHIENVDVLDGTPLLDIKPYVPEFDHHPADRIGWLKQVKEHIRNQKSDERFSR